MIEIGRTRIDAPPRSFKDCPDNGVIARNRDGEPKLITGSGIKGYEFFFGFKQGSGGGTDELCFGDFTGIKGVVYVGIEARIDSDTAKRTIGSDWFIT